MANTMSKSALIQRIVEGHPSEIARKDVKGVIDAVAAIGHKELKKTGAFVVPGLAKFIVIKKPATKARQGINPFTKEPTVFKAKPAQRRRSVTTEFRRSPGGHHRGFPGTSSIGRCHDALGLSCHGDRCPVDRCNCLRRGQNSPTASSRAG
jgi:DNA-binding protein HU-beta